MDIFSDIQAVFIIPDRTPEKRGGFHFQRVGSKVIRLDHPTKEIKWTAVYSITPVGTCIFRFEKKKTKKTQNRTCLSCVNTFDCRVPGIQ